MSVSRTRAPLRPAQALAAWMGFVLASSLIAVELIARTAIDDPIDDANLIGMVDRGSDLRRMTPGKSWRTKAGVEIHINDQGFRSRYTGSTIGPKPSGATRIAVLGDSETFCRALAYDDCLPGRLEITLNSKFQNARFQVLSYGIPGTNTRDHQRWLREIVLPMKPDVVLLNYVMNDIELFDNTTLVDLGHWYDHSLAIRALRYAFFARKTVALQREKGRIYTRWYAGHDDRIWADYFASLYANPELWYAMRHTLSEMRQETELSGASFVVTALATLAAVTNFEFEQYRYRDALAKLRTLQEDGIRFIDTLPAYVQAGQPARHYTVSDLDLHHNAAGNRLLVDFIVAHAEFGTAIERVAVETADSPET